jgi:hypothetical protein
MKANMNYVFFNRIANEVTISPNKEYLLLNETVDPLSKGSSFIPVSKNTIDSLVISLNHIYYYYKSKGFDDVYFAIIPNPVTILFPEIGNYNELIPRIQNNKNLIVPIVNIYDNFRQIKNSIYEKSDSHWTNNGFILWVNEFNNILMTAYEK